MCCPASAAPSAPSSKANPCSRSPHSFPPQSPLPPFPPLPRETPQFTPPLCQGGRAPIHPSPLPGGRLGGGWEATNQHHRSSRAPIVPPHPHRTHPLRRACPSRHTRTPFAIPAPPFRHSCAGRNHPPQHPPPPPIHPSPLEGGRLGGGWKVASQHHRSPRATIAPPHPHRTHPSVAPAPPAKPASPLAIPTLSVIPAPPQSFLRPLSVIPAQAGTTHPNIRPFPQFIPPPFQGGG